VDVRLLYPNEYVAAADLIEAQRKTGKTGVTLTIASVAVESLKTNRGSEKKPIVRFKEMEARAAKGGSPAKKLVLNKTNAKLIAKMHGFETEAWAGKQVTLFPTQCEAFGETVDCIRVMITQTTTTDGVEYDRDTGEVLPADLPTAQADPQPAGPAPATRRQPPAYAPSPRPARGNGGTKTAEQPEPVPTADLW